jgi:hypothetical protein
MTPKVVVFLGPCRKVDRKNGKLHPPFSELSRSGKFLRGLVNGAVLQNIRVEYDNILEIGVFTPLGQECNPGPDQLVKPLLEHRIWREADVVIALSSTVRRAFEIVKREMGADAPGKRLDIHFIDHPSYIMRRPQAERSAYTKTIQEIMQRAALLRS